MWINTRKHKNKVITQNKLQQNASKPGEPVAYTLH